MYQKILVPLDGSPLAESVLPHVQMLAENHAAEIILLQVVVDPVYDLLMVGPKLATASRAQAPTLRITAEHYLNGVALQLRAQGLKVTTLVSEGIVAESILACGAQAQVDLIVLATHGVHSPGNWQLGNIAYRVIHNAPVPVLVIRAKQPTFKCVDSSMAFTQIA